MDYKKLNAIIYAILAALFYAVNVPCSKWLLNDVPPTFMAAFLYLGAGVGVGLVFVALLLFVFDAAKIQKYLKHNKLTPPTTNC